MHEAALLRDFQQLPRQNTTAYRDWENWLKGGESSSARNLRIGLRDAAS